MKTVKIELKEGVYEMIEKYANLRKMPVEKAVAILVEKFAPVTHSMLVEELIKGYGESAEENLDWANL